MSNGGDSRLANRAQAQGQMSQNRDGRMQDERAVTENREMSDDERLENFQNMLFQQTLPVLPPIPGYHICWLTTNNPRDSISQRAQWGYTPIKSSELPGWEHVSLKTGDYAGVIGINEMIACKIKISLYEKYMMHAHHTAPQSEEEKINAMVEMIADEAKRKGASVLIGDGTQELGKGPRRPQFEGIS